MAQNTNQQSGRESNQGGRGSNQGGRDSNQGGRGFASMDEDKQRAIAAEGGRAAHAQGTAHEFDSEEAREAGRKGGQASHGSRGDSGGMQAGGREQGGSGRERDEQGQFTSDDRGGRNN